MSDDLDQPQPARDDEASEADWAAGVLGGTRSETTDDDGLVTSVVRRTLLPSGLRIVTEQMAGVRSASIGVWVGVGSADEDETLHGCSHFLEHVVDYKATLAEWWRVVKPGGHLVLYLPHAELYPRIGQPGSNPDHKHDFLPDDILNAMKAIATTGADVVEDEVRGAEDEYSFFQVYRKRSDGAWNYVPWRKPEQKNVLVVRYGAIGDQITTASVLFFDSLVGYTLAKFRFRGRRVVFLAILSTLMIPTEMLVLPWYVMSKNLGWLDTYWGIMFPGMMTAFGTFLMKQFFEGVPDDFLEAARIDGLNEFTIWWKIAMPLVTPALSALAIFTFLGNWTAFFWPLIVTTSAELYTLPVGLSSFAVEQSIQWEKIMTGASIATLPTLVIFLFLQRYIVRGVMLAGLKG